MKATIFHKTWDDAEECDRYDKTVVNALHIQNEQALTISGKTVYSGDQLVFYLPIGTTVDKEDMIAKGECPAEGETKAELLDAGCLLVTFVHVLDYGSAHMQHIKVIAK